LWCTEVGYNQCNFFSLQSQHSPILKLLLTICIFKLLSLHCYFNKFLNLIHLLYCSNQLQVTHKFKNFSSVQNFQIFLGCRKFCPRNQITHNLIFCFFLEVAYASHPLPPLIYLFIDFLLLDGSLNLEKNTFKIQITL
jgi:hypothetical protein